MLDKFSRPQYLEFRHHGIRYALRRFLPFAVEPQLLDGAGIVFITGPFKGIVVKVGVSRTHAAHIEGDGGPPLVDHRLQVISDLDARRDTEINVVKTAAGFFGTFAKIVEVGFRVIR